MACKILGGTEVDTEKDAATFADLPELQGQEVVVGQFVELPPCVPDHHLAEIEKQKGTPCPRPGLAMDPDNEVPLDLMELSLMEHTRHLVEGTLHDLVPTMDRGKVRRRVALALQDPVVTRRFYPLRKD